MIAIFGAWEYDKTYLDYIYPYLNEHILYSTEERLNINNICFRHCSVDTIYLYSNSFIDKKILRKLYNIGVKNIVFRNKNCYKYLDMKEARKYQMRIYTESDFFKIILQ